MNIDIKMNADFEISLDEMKRKYGEDFEILNGIHESHTNFSDFIDGFIDKNVADVTIDANANASNKDIRSLLSEKGKPHDKLFAFNKIFYEMKKKWGLKTARKWFELEYNGGYYLHDASTSTYMPYCYAYDLTRLAREGLFFLNHYNAQPPKHLTTFLDDVIEYISYMSNRTSGACGIPNVLIWTFYFWKKDCETGYAIKNPDYYVRQIFQKLIYRLNQPFMRIDQTAFVNMSIFDRNYVEALFGGLEYPDGTFLIDYVDEFIEHEKIFMEVVSEIRQQNMFTFPVLTYSLLYKNGKFVDEEFARWCSDHNTIWNDSNFFVSGDVTTLSNCPMSGDTKILYYSDMYHKYNISDIKTLYNTVSKWPDNLIRKGIKVLSNGNEVYCRVNKFNIPIEYEIVLANGAKLKTTANHLNKVLGKSYVETKDLTTNDYLPFDTRALNISDNLSYEDGFIVGMFLGDGSYRNKTEVCFSLNDNGKKELIDFIYDYCPTKFGAVINTEPCTSVISGETSCYNVCVNSMYLRGLIEMFVDGNEALTKAISGRAFMQSINFRKGIIDGLYATDGGNSNRIYTFSEKLKDTLIALFASLGIVANISTDNRPGRLSENTCYIVRYYTPGNRTKLKDVYIIDGNYTWIKIKEINKISNGSNVSYCMEVLDPNAEPVFTLANGIVTHNCRLLSDTSKLSGFINSIGGTALSIGSIKVNTINLMRIAYEALQDSGMEEAENKYLDILRERTDLCCKVLDTVRHIIHRNIEKGLLPNYCDGGIELDKQYCTIGILGLYEVIEAFGYTTVDEFGYTYYTDKGIEFASKIFEVINNVKDSFTKEYSFNIESVPAERAAVILCQKDNLMYERKDKFIYSNQWIPLSVKCTLKEKLRTAAILDNKCSGGAIAHINLESNFPNTDMAWENLNMIAQSGVIYFAYNTRLNECKNHHGFVGTDHCPICGEPVYDTYQRIVGYLVPTRSYSHERFMEFNTRQWYAYSEMLKE